MWYHKFEQMLEGAHKMEKLSRMQQRVYDYIAESIAEHGYAPSVREVGEALGLKSPSTVHFHIKHLQEMGLIEKSAGKGRAITLKKQLQAVPGLRRSPSRSTSCSAPAVRCRSSAMLPPVTRFWLQELHRGLPDVRHRRAR